LFNGGGRVFGPQPRDYSFKLNKKLKSLARKSALTYKAKDNNIVVLEAFTFDSIKTANYAKIVADLKLTDVKSLLVLPAANNNVYLSSRNLKKAKVVTAAELNTFDVLNAGTLLLTTETVKTLEEAFAK
jgi:large subunit ribosomal protein L4